MSRGSGMAPTRRRNRRVKLLSPEALAASLPDELRSFDGYSDPRCTPGGEHTADCGCRRGWHYPSGLHDYMAAVSRFIGPGFRVTPVMEAAGLSAAEWFRTMLERKASAATA